VAALRGILLLCGMLAAAPAVPALLDAQVKRSGARFEVGFTVQLPAPPEQVIAVFAEPRRWTALSTIIRAVEAVEGETGNPAPVSMTFHDCILFLCFDAVKVSRYRIDAAAGTIDGDSLPGAGDFVYVTERWTVAAHEGGTRLGLSAELQPGFRVPPLIGTLVLKSRLKKLLREMEENLALMP
jgi:hypothetical protein